MKAQTEPQGFLNCLSVLHMRVCVCVAEHICSHKCVRKHELVLNMKKDYIHVPSLSFSIKLKSSFTLTHVHTHTHTVKHTHYIHTVKGSD